ncbi:MAG: NAD-dependent epimerase/dehydratase family protein [Candidatus Omnitrophica bacterium]|nr:NAD-dependent epimerase/dehydratase family protein [Candidatus Omnitrophota bacterium]
MKKQKILVTGAGGFIGHHMVSFLKKRNYWVRGVDIKYPEYSPKDEADEFIILDLRDLKNCLRATKGIDKVYHFAANMGGIGYITEIKAAIMRDNFWINTNIAEACRVNGVKRLFFSSSACVYPTFKQNLPSIKGLKENDAYPADPDNEYGWEKLLAERLFNNFYLDYGLEVRIARYHNVFGPEGTYDGGKEKAPAAICRKVALAKNGDEIKIWGDGKQTRSFLYIDDCLEGTFCLMESDYKEPLNIGSDKKVTINELVDIVSKIAGKKLKKTYQLNKPQGVRGRNADISLAKKVINWQPKISLEEGLRKTYFWIFKMVNLK